MIPLTDVLFGSLSQDYETQTRIADDESFLRLMNVGAQVNTPQASIGRFPLGILMGCKTLQEFLLLLKSLRLLVLPLEGKERELQKVEQLGSVSERRGGKISHDLL